jgi:hypothetical protein
MTLHYFTFFIQNDLGPTQLNPGILLFLSKL